MKGSIALWGIGIAVAAAVLYVISTGDQVELWHVSWDAGGLRVGSRYYSTESQARAFEKELRAKKFEGISVKKELGQRSWIYKG